MGARRHPACSMSKNRVLSAANKHNRLSKSSLGDPKVASRLQILRQTVLLRRNSRDRTSIVLSQEGGLIRSSSHRSFRRRQERQEAVTNRYSFHLRRRREEKIEMEWAMPSPLLCSQIQQKRRFRLHFSQQARRSIWPVTK